MNGTQEDEHPAIADFVAMGAEKRAQFLRSLPHPSEALCTWADELDRLSTQDVAAALSASVILLEAAQTLGFARSLARVRRARVLALAYSGAFDEAFALAVAARKDAVTAGERVEAARALLAQMQPLLVTGKPQEALAAGTQARDELQSCGENVLAARVEINLANIHKALHDPRAALGALDSAASVLSTHPDMAAHIANARGEALFLLDRFADARSAFAQALDFFSPAGGMAAAVVEGNLADVAARQGQYQEALERFAKARERLGSAPSAHAARMVAEEGEVFEMLGLPAVASTKYAEGMGQYDRLGMAYEALRTAIGNARVLDAAGDSEASAAAFAQAADRAGKLGNRAEESWALLQRASTLAKAGRVGEAQQSLASVNHASLVGPLDHAMLHFHSAVVAERAGILATALTEAESTLNFAAEAGIPPVQADALALKAMLLRRSNRHHDAAREARRAVGIIEQMRGSLQAERARAGLLSRRLGAYEELVAALLADGSSASVAEAFAVAEQARSRALLDRMRQALGGSQTSTAGPATEEMRQLRQRLDALYARVASDSQSGIRQGLPEAVRTEIAEVEGRISLLESSEIAQGRRTLTNVAPSNADSVSSTLSGDSAMLSYYRTKGRWMAFVTTKNSTHAVPLECDDTILCEAIGRLGFQLRRGLSQSGAIRPRLVHDAIACLDRISSMIWAPVARHLDGISKVVVVPHGPLHTLPFHALVTGGKFVVYSHEITYAPSASIWNELKSRETKEFAPGQTRVVGVADPAAPCIEQEARTVAQLVGDLSPLMGIDATVARVRACLETATSMHIACHGFFLPEAPSSSGLKLTDGWLTARDISELRCTPATVVLSGCETAVTSVREGDELLGLATAFLGNTTNQLLATLWPVHDGTTADAMASLYAISDSGRRASPASAARKLSLDLAERTPHPAHWAPFALIGA